MPELLTPDDIAAELDYSPQWVRSLLRDGKIKGQKLNHQWVITREDLDEYLAKLKAKDAAPDPRE